MWQYQQTEIMQEEQKETEVQEFMYGYQMCVEHELYDYTGHKWSQQNSNKRCKIMWKPYQEIIQ